VTTLLLTNDDGWNAPGIEALRQAALGLGDCHVIAPAEPLSGCSHRVTTHGPIRVTRPTVDHIAVAGTPADCVRLALHHLAPGLSWVLAGVNSGGNLGTDVHYSGTVAAVREGVINGVPGIAVSHYIARGRLIDWSRAARWAREVLVCLMARPWEPGTFWNVNLPHLRPEDPEPEIVFCPLDSSPLPLSYQVEEGQAVYAGDYQTRVRRVHSDVDVCFGGRIAVTLVRVTGHDVL
jgi:5'-nucleotidase